MNSLQPSAFNLAPPPTLQWQPVQIANFTAVAGNSYPCNTTSTAFTVTLPASPRAGDEITLTDYAGTWNTNNLTVNPNGLKINGFTAIAVLSTNRGSVQLVYVDATQGWAAYSGFAVTTLPTSYNIEIFVLGGGAGANAGGGGSGGISYNSALTVTPGTAYTATVGPGGASATAGTDSTFSGAGITTVRGYGGGTGGTPGVNGGSGGGGFSNGAETTLRLGGTATQGAGGTTYYGSNGGSNSSIARGQGGGGGTGAVGQDAQAISGSFNGGANGGNGTSAFSSWLTVISQGVDSGGTRYIGGGGAGANSATSVLRTGGLGGGGDAPASTTANGSSGLANCGGGGGGSWSGTQGAGGSGIICIRYAGAQRGTGGTIVSSGGYTYHTFTGNGTYTA